MSVCDQVGAVCDQVGAVCDQVGAVNCEKETRLCQETFNIRVSCPYDCLLCFVYVLVSLFLSFLCPCFCPSPCVLVCPCCVCPMCPKSMISCVYSCVTPLQTHRHTDTQHSPCIRIHTLRILPSLIDAVNHRDVNI